MAAFVMQRLRLKAAVATRRITGGASRSSFVCVLAMDDRYESFWLLSLAAEKVRKAEFVKLVYGRFCFLQRCLFGPINESFTLGIKFFELFEDSGLFHWCLHLEGYYLNRMCARE